MIRERFKYYESVFFLSTPNSPQTKRGANGKFLPKSRIFSCWKIPLPRLAPVLRPCEATLLTLLFHLQHPNSKTNEPKFWQILFLQKLYTFHILNTKCSRSCESVPHFLTPKNSFAKTSSALVPPPARSIEGEEAKVWSFRKTH